MECANCKGEGRVNDIRVAGITHKVTTVRRTCRVCKGSGRLPDPVGEAVEIGEIPAWMLGE